MILSFGWMALGPAPCAAAPIGFSNKYQIWTGFRVIYISRRRVLVFWIRGLVDLILLFRV